MHLNTLRNTLLALAACAALHAPTQAADGSKEVSQGAVSMAASPLGSIEGGPIAASTYFVVGASFVVVGIGTIVGDAMEVIIQNTVDGSKAVVRGSAAVARQVGLSVGNGIKVVAESTGYALVASGKILAFVPNAVGKELLYQSKLSQ
ncbi:hypothetical protein [Collimonas humicola]|uniref:hypothetical protein n=1 Tax=Collimonas humicola TaxID=2825886 RepID=UPI001B8B368E|nr:hypothetical protein [Collimonas humicola]